MIETLRQAVGSGLFLSVWAATSAIALLTLVVDLHNHNAQLGRLMKFVWGLTVAYSGVLGLAMYFWAGRQQIRRDSLWRKGLRSTAHCYSGCGAGEVIGVFLAAGLMGMGQLGISVVTFVLAYVLGLALTVGPLVQDGEELGVAFRDAALSESASIVVMEAVAIGVDLLLARSATLGQPLFWGSIAVSLTLGLLAAYPVNVLLVQRGVKAGMADPRG